MPEFEVKRLYKFDNGGATKAMVDIAINEEFLIKGFRVVNGKNGLFVGVPRQPGKDGKWYATVVPLKPEVKQELEDCVLAAYDPANSEG